VRLDGGGHACVFGVDERDDVERRKLVDRQRVRVALLGNQFGQVHRRFSLPIKP